MTELQLAKEIIKVLDRKKGFDIKLIETFEHTIVGDYFIIVTGTSNTHIKALTDEVDYELKLLGVNPDHIEGKATGWILMDYTSVLVHVFTPESREYYNLEHLWRDAKEIDISDIITEE